ncbi:hypothetical protein NHG23_05340 [Aerococcaceae bacterium NML190073]|nr:hypothetical protein [Aerococcaceae bacterium NML190073]
MEHDEEVIKFWRGWCERIYRFVLIRWRICYEYTEQLDGRNQETFRIFMQTLKALDDAQRQLLIRVYFQDVTIREAERIKHKKYSLLLGTPMYCYTQDGCPRKLIASEMGVSTAQLSRRLKEAKQAHSRLFVDEMLNSGVFERYYGNQYLELGGRL